MRNFETKLFEMITQNTFFFGLENLQNLYVSMQKCVMGAW